MSWLQSYEWLDADIRNRAGSTTTPGPGVRRLSDRSAVTVSKLVIFAVCRRLARAVKSGLLSSVTASYECLNASFRHS